MIHMITFNKSNMHKGVLSPAVPLPDWWRRRGGGEAVPLYDRRKMCAGGECTTIQTLVSVQPVAVGHCAAPRARHKCTYDTITGVL